MLATSGEWPKPGCEGASTLPCAASMSRNGAAGSSPSSPCSHRIGCPCPRSTISSRTPCTVIQPVCVTLVAIVASDYIKEWPRSSTTLKQRDDARRRYRRLGDAHAERRQRVLDGVGNCRRRRDRAAFAEPLDPERVARRWELQVHRLDRRQVVGLGDGIIHQRSGQELARLVVH